MRNATTTRTRRTWPKKPREDAINSKALLWRTYGTGATRRKLSALSMTTTVSSIEYWYSIYRVYNIMPPSKSESPHLRHTTQACRWPESHWLRWRAPAQLVLCHTETHAFRCLSSCWLLALSWMWSLSFHYPQDNDRKHIHLNDSRSTFVGKFGNFSIKASQHQLLGLIDIPAEERQSTPPDILLFLD